MHMFFNRRVYLDWASAAPVHRKARRAFWRAALSWGNPSSPHAEGRQAREVLERARTDIARLIEVKPDDIIFTSGATEANNLAIRGLAGPGTHVLYLPSAHASVIESVRALEGVVIEPLPIRDGRVDIEALKKLVRPTTVLVSMDAVCGETGTIWNTREVKEALRKKGTNTLLHVDASQAPLSQKISRAHFDADLLTFDAQKAGGMRGAGVLVAPRTIPLKPVIVGGGQERGLRSGTPAPASAAALAAALAAASRGREAFAERSRALRVRLVAELEKGIPNLYINEGAATASNILNLSLPGRDTDYIVTLLDTAGFAVSTRSACESDSAEGSRAVFALTHDRERALSTLRISWGPGVGERDLGRFAEALAREVLFVDNEKPKSHY
jgi:cysteine desulfurase